MYLKSLKLVGFKSFADRTRLELRPGVTVVVGPNGSGKSNLVDAVSWVMGTQSSKALRTARMEDVVFAGTATRPSLNRAEVTLLFDNATRILPLDLDEVSITRRLYRDGSSDYEINGAACRLLDVQELLSDSGVGRHQHVIVGQGQIDSVLSSGPLDHRAVIEEAAGILKHRQRKDRALRRLERTDADVVRLVDLVTELARQMRPLRRQARDAEAHGRLVDEVAAIRLYLAGEKLRHIDETAATRAAERTELLQSEREGEAELEELASALHILVNESGTVGQALDRDTTSAARLETILERLRRIASVAHERHGAAVASREGIEEQRRDLSEELSSLSEELDTCRGRVREIQVLAGREERRFRGLENEARTLADQGDLTPEGALAVVRGEVRSLEAGESRDARESEQIDDRLAVLVAQIGVEVAEIDTLNGEIRDLDDEAAACQSAFDTITQERARLQERWEVVEAEHSRSRLELAAAEARLAAMREAAEGRADPESRRLVDGAEGRLGSIASVLDTPGDLAAAVDAALGLWAEAVAFRTHEELSRVVSQLKSAGHGGVPVVSVPEGGEAPARAVAASVGAEALVDLLGPAADRPLAARLLGDVIVVEGWGAGWRAVARHPEVRAVTPEGDLISAYGIRIAHPDGATPAMVESAEVTLERAEIECARVESLRTSARRDFDRSRQNERQALEALEAVEARLSGASESLGRLRRSRVTLEEEKARLEERSRALAEQRVERAESLAGLRGQVAALEGEEAERQKAWEETEQRRAVAEASREEARSAWQQAVADLRAAEERVTLLQHRRQTIEETLSTGGRAPATEGTLDRLALVAESARSAIAAISGRLETLRERQAELRARAGHTGAQRDRVRARHEALRSELEERRQRLSEVDVELAELRVRRESVAEGLRRDADADEAQALTAPPPVFAEEAAARPLADLLTDLEARLRRMGPVNPLAAQEYAELEERHEFLTSQLADLEASRDELRRVVSALDDEIQGRFLGAFSEVASAYEEHFALLFPGGSGSLVLSDPAEPLTSGVDIRAQPLGKKVSQLSLLSGGEKSLAALAFLFAVFKARPSPFYILDEVEAALDDANLRRFMRLIDAFRTEAQLVVVTHQQQTMEAADVLYGVTMEPGGSSTVVRKQLVPFAQGVQV